MGGKRGLCADQGLGNEYATKAYDASNSVAVGVIDSFESKVPHYKGLIPKTLGNFVLFVIYKLIVLYIICKVLFFFLRLGFGILSCVICCLCCCRCCRRSAKAPAKTAKKNGNTNRATNGNTAKATAKAAGKA